MALHRVFDSPHDPIIFDTGHQAYVHKMLTGRSQDFATLRKKGGLSGYPSRAESEHDWVESSHASAALSYADGLAKAFELTGHRNRHVVAVVGDGALTGGMCWEALNNIAASRRPVIIVVNDNGRSYAPTIGGVADHLATLRLQPAYEQALETGRDLVRAVPLVGGLWFRFLHSVKAGIKDSLSPQLLFTDLGLKYVGPVDGHDERAVEVALRSARRFGAPVIVHVVTRKGMATRRPRPTRPSRCIPRSRSIRPPDKPPRWPAQAGRRPSLMHLSATPRNAVTSWPLPRPCRAPPG